MRSHRATGRPTGRPAGRPAGRPLRGHSVRRRSLISGGALAALGFAAAVYLGLPKILNEGITVGIGVALNFVKAYAIFLTDVLMNNLKLVAIAAAIFLLFKLAGGLTWHRRRADLKKWTERED